MDPSDLFQRIATDLADPDRLTELMEAEEPRAARPEEAPPYVAPRTPLEESLTGLWERLLGVDRVGVDDDFFALGGHSLLGTQLLSRVAAATGARLPLRALFEAPTPAGLALRIEAEGAAAPAADTPTERVSRGADAPLSPAQQRLWFLQQLAPEDPSYTIPVLLRASGPLDAAALERAVAEVVRRHEVLRTTYPHVRGEPVQRVGPVPSPALARTDLAAVAAGEGEAAVGRAVAEALARPFDLTAGPVFRARLWRLDREEHRLLFTVHHIAFDGWSMGVLLRELAILYDAFSRGEASPLAEPPLQYADYAAGQRRWLEGEEMRSQLAWWRRRLGGFEVEALELPADRPRPPVRSHRGARVRYPLPGALATRLQQLGQGEGATLFMVLLAGFQALLHRITGRHDLWVGTPVANRTQVETEELIGFFINTLVLRGDTSGDPSFRALVARVREATLGAYDHQDLPFDLLVEELQPERSLGYQPLFQVLFALQNAPRPAASASASGLRLEPLAADTGTARFDLALSMEEGDGVLAALLEYSVDLFDRATVRRLAGHLETLLTSAAAEPDRPLSHLDLLTPAERHQTLREWNDRRRAYPRQALVHELLEAQARRTPEAVALVLGRGALSYGELNRRANRLAHHLRRLGAVPEARVALLLERSFDAVAAIFGVLKSGAAYVPLDPDYPADRLAFMLADSRPVALVSRRRLLEGVPVPEGLPIVDLDAPAPAAGPGGDPAPTADPDNLAYAIYTSGSTGAPKGVLVAHRGLVSLAQMMAGMFGVGPGRRVLQLFSFSFDASMWDLLMALPVGAILRVAPPEARAPGPLLEGLLREAGVEVVTLPPSLLAVLPAAELPGVRTVIATGEACSSEVVALWAPGRRFFNGYGPTETTVGTTIGPCLAGDGTPSIGRPFHNARVLLLDPALQPVPMGVPGEVYAGGVGVARGYLHRPGLTALRFVPDPVAGGGGDGEVGGRLYRTGDLARFRPDGRLEFLGRADHQLKVRGFRVEPEEIEACLARHPGVAEIAVVPRWEEVGPLRLVAWFVPRSEPAPEAAELRAFLRRSLPDYMIPALFAPAAGALPRQPGGKIDRRLLARTPLPAATGTASRRPPRGRAEESLARIWSEVLRVEGVSGEDNFFELGGDSILSIQVVARAREAGLLLTPRQLFEHHTLAELAAAAAVAPADVEPGPVAGPLVATPIQRWFFELGLPVPRHWNQAVLLELRRPVDPGRLTRALDALTTHHDALRLRAMEEGDSWRLWNAPPEPAAVSHVDLSALPAPRRQGALEATLAAAQAALDLEGGPVARFVLVERGRGEPPRLLATVHHLAVDAVSWRILLGDLEAVYARLERGEAPGLPPRGTSFRRWGERLAAHAKSGAVGGELPWWTAEERSRVERLPVDDPEAADLEETARHHRVSFSAAETGALLHELPRGSGTRPEEALLAALALALSAWTGRRHLLVDLEGHGREEIVEGVDLSRTVGWFTALYPLLLEVPASAEPGATLAAVKAHLRSVPGRGLGYGLLRYLAGGEAAARLAALHAAEVSFNYLGQLGDTSAESSLFTLVEGSPGPLRHPQGRRSHRLEINAGVTDGRLHVTWTYGGAVLRPATVEALARGFGDALRALIATGGGAAEAGPVAADFPLAGLSEEELDALAEDLVDPDEDLP